MRKLSSAVSAVLFVILVANSPSLLAQTATGTILGRVVGRDGIALPDATVTVINEGTNARAVAITNSRGAYEVPLLPPGNYRVETTLTGFNTVVREGIQLQVRQRALIDVVLGVGDISFTVTVEADAPMIDATSAGLGTVIDNTQIVELPLKSRDFFQLSTTVPGVLPSAEGTQNSTQGGAVSVNGAREQANDYLLDGVDNKNPAINQIVIPPSIDAVQEYKVQTSTYNAEFGRSAGGHFNYVTKSGSNDWHGSAYLFHRNDGLEARNFFDDPGKDKPEFRRNQFGFTFGGPLMRDKLFVFGSYESTDITRGFTRIATVPPTAWINGDFSSMLTGTINPATGFDAGQLFDPRSGAPIPGNVIPASMIDSAGAGIAAFYPSPDDPTATGPTDATVSPAGDNRIHQFNIRVDQPFGTGDRLFYRYSFWDEDRFNAFDPLVDPTNIPGFGSFTKNRGQNLAIGWTQTIGTNTINDFRFGFNSLVAGIFQEHIGNDVSSQLGISGLSTQPVRVGRPGAVLGITDDLIEPTNLPQERDDWTVQFNDSISWWRESHSLKAGVDVRTFNVSAFLDPIARGQFIFFGISGNPIADLLLGFPGLAIRMNPAVNSDVDLRTTAFNAYVQDDWTVTDSLTLNVGLRYDYNQPAYDVQDRLSVPDLDSPDGRFVEVGTEGIPRAGYDSDTNNFAPRIGVAWLPFETAQMVVRGGYGIYYDTGILNANILPRFNPPFFSLDLVPFPGSLQNAFAGDAALITLVGGIDRGYRDGYYHQFSAGVQHEIAPDWLLEVTYVGSRGRDLQHFLDSNQGPEGGPPVRNPAFGPAQIAFSEGSSSYNSIQTRVQRRFVDGFSLLSSYTWSRSRDNTSSLFGGAALAGGPQNSFDLDAEWGPSDFDAPHRWVTSYVWELPVGRGRRYLGDGGWASAIFGDWQFAGIVAFQSGRPFTVHYGLSNHSGTSNGANGGFGLDRPNLVGDPDVANPGADLWFDPSAFAPPDNAFGNVGRNTLRGDGLQNFDLAVYRNVDFDAGRRMQIRFEIFNAFNATRFFLPIGDLDNANAGRVVQAHDSRQLQLGLKLSF